MDFFYFHSLYLVILLACNHGRNWRRRHRYIKKHWFVYSFSLNFFLHGRKRSCAFYLHLPPFLLLFFLALHKYTLMTMRKCVEIDLKGGKKKTKKIYCPLCVRFYTVVFVACVIAIVEYVHICVFNRYLTLCFIFIKNVTICVCACVCVHCVCIQNVHLSHVNNKFFLFCFAFFHLLLADFVYKHISPLLIATSFYLFIF